MLGVQIPPSPQRKEFLLLKNFNVVGTFKSKIYYVPQKVGGFYPEPEVVHGRAPQRPQI